MRTVEKIVELAGGWSDCDLLHLKVENPPYMDLVIETVGRSPEGHRLVSVAHYFEQNGDLCQDPEMVFEVGPNGWRPVFFQMAIPPVYKEAVHYEYGTDTGVTVQVNHRELRDQLQFARVWDKNLRGQGFLEAARKGVAE
jgi:hypothetical protein